MRSVVVGVEVLPSPLPALAPDPVPLSDDPPLLLPLLLVPDVGDEPVVVFCEVVEVLVDGVALPELGELTVDGALGAGVMVVMLVAAALLPAPALVDGASLLPPPQAASSVTKAATGGSLKAVMTKHFHAIPLGLPVNFRRSGGARRARMIVSGPLAIVVHHLKDTSGGRQPGGPSRSTFINHRWHLQFRCLQRPSFSVLAIGRYHLYFSISFSTGCYCHPSAAIHALA
jgi:hypothetical protein